MTSKTSSVKNSPTSNFFRFTLKKQTPLTVLITAFSFLLIPGMLFRDMMVRLTWSSARYDMDYDSFFIWVTLALGASAVLMFMLLLSNFGFLFSKKAGDVFHALPLTRNQMLFTRGAASFIGGAFNYVLCFVVVAFVNFLPNVRGVPAGTVLKAFLLGLLYLLAMTAFSLIFVVCSGGMFDTLVAFASANLGPVLIVLMLLAVAENSVTGVDIEYDYLVYTSPIAYMFYKFISLSTVEEYPETALQMEKTTVWSVAAIVLFTVACVVASVKLFKVRKSETAGEAYSFKFVPAIITVIVSMVGGFFIAEILNGFNTGFNALFWFFFIIGALLCSVAAGAVITRGFKTVKASFVRGAVSVAIMIVLVITTMCVSDVAEKRVPEIDRIKEIQLFYDKSVVFTENFDVVIDLHKGIVENIENDANTYTSTTEFSNNLNDIKINYVLKNSQELKRNYWMGRPNMDNLRPQLLALMQTDEYFKRYEDCVRSNGLNVQVQLMGEKYGYTNTVYDDGIADLTKEQANEFINLFKEEVKAADESVFDENCYVVYINGIDSKTLFIPHSFTKTMDYIGPLLVPEDEYYDSFDK